MKLTGHQFATIRPFDGDSGHTRQDFHGVDAHALGMPLAAAKKRKDVGVSSTETSASERRGSSRTLANT